MTAPGRWAVRWPLDEPLVHLDRCWVHWSPASSIRLGYESIGWRTVFTSLKLARAVALVTDGKVYRVKS